MSLTRRVQILMDEERYAALEREAGRLGTSVASLIRTAVDRTYGGGEVDRAAAGRRLLDAEPMPVEDWVDMKRAMLDEMSGG